jgi:hypothetical protein
VLDLYEVLGVPEDATQEEIRRAYRAAARREHPDVSGRPDAAERMQSLNDAFRVLGDEKTRDAYDHGRIPPQGWGDERNPWDPWDPDPPRPRRRRAVRLLAVLLLLAGAVAAVAVLFVYEERVEGRLPPAVASAPSLDESFDAPAASSAAPSGGLRSFTADAEGCTLWQEFDDHVARPVETLRGAVLLARMGPQNTAERRRAIRRMAPLVAGASEAFAEIVALVGTQEAAHGAALPWRGLGAELSRAAQLLSRRYDNFADTGRMPRAAPAPVVRAYQAVQRADELHERLATVCAPALAGS